MCGFLFDPDLEKATFILGNHERFKSRLSKENNPGLEWQSDFFVPKFSLEAISFGHSTFGKVDLRSAALHGDRFWAQFGESKVVTIYKDKTFEEAEIIDNDLLNGDMVMKFVSTAHGLVAIGRKTVGLIQIDKNGKQIR